MKVVPVPVRDDNYAYLLIDEPSNKAAAVDPYDVDKVTAAAKEQGVQIVAAITTHHHYDHAGGNKAFAAKFPGVPIYGGSTLCDAADKIVKDKEEFKVGDSIDIRCLATPCHTQDSICYYVTDKKNKNQPGGVFTGDTLFIGGCGRFFEGTGGEMLRALSYLGTLPGETIVYNGHEYTSGNVAFGQKIDPENADIKRLATLAKENSVTTGLTTIADEKKWNVFMRLNSEAVRKATNTDENNRDEYVMETLRDQKNKFRG